MEGRCGCVCVCVPNRVGAAVYKERGQELSKERDMLKGFGLCELQRTFRNHQYVLHWNFQGRPEKL